MGSHLCHPLVLNDNKYMASRENSRSLHFHKICGDNIELLKNGKVAYRTSGFNHGLTFTDRPVMVDEVILIKIEETATNWSGAFRLGFTINDPSSMKSKLPAHSCPDFVSVCGNWAKALPESLNKVNALIAFYVNKRGDVYYRHNDGTEKLLLTKVDTKRKMWGVIDVYGNTAKVELLPDPNTEDSLSNFDATFHTKHGLHIKLDEKKILASREGGISNSYVFSCQPMLFDEKVVIKILDIDPCIKGPFEYGLTSCDPSNLQMMSLPRNGEDLIERSSEYWVYERDIWSYNCEDIVTFMLKSNELFIVIRNGNAVSTKLHVDTTKPLWLFFKLSGSILKICMMGTSVKEYVELIKEFKELKVTSSQVETNRRMSRELSIGECVVCFDKLVDCTLYRCGHMCMCYECANIMRNRFDNCPVCRKIIEDVIRVYT